VSELYVTEGSASNWQEAIQLASQELIKNHCVTDDFYESCVEREKEYPTGLTEICPVAIPHTTKEHVTRQSISVVRLTHPVKFHSMEDMDKEIDVQIVMNLALLNDDEHIVIIQKLINGLKEEDFIHKLLTLPVDELKELLEKTLN